MSLLACTDAFVGFLEDSLIPQLYDDGDDVSAEDFETAVAFMSGEDSVSSWPNSQEFVEYIRGVRIPELEGESPTEAYKEAVRCLTRRM